MSEKHLEILESQRNFLYTCQENEDLIAELYARGSMTRSQIEDGGYAVKKREHPEDRFKTHFRRLLGIGVMYQEELDFKLTPNCRAMLDAWMAERSPSPEKTMTMEQLRTLNMGSLTDPNDNPFIVPKRPRG